MPSRGLPSSHSHSHHPTTSFFAPSNDTTRIVDFSQQHSQDDDDQDEPGSRFDTPDSTPSTPSFSFTSSPPSEHYTIFPPSSSSSSPHSPSTLPTILPIPFPASTSSPNLSKLNTSSPPPAYTSKFPAGLRVDASPTSPQRTLPPSNPIHAFLLRTIPHSLLPESIKNPSSSLAYPRSPSLLRPHPTTRHPLSASTNGRPPLVSRTWLPKRWIVVIVFSLFLFLGYASLPSFSSGESETNLRGWEQAWEKAKLSTGWDRGNRTSEMGEEQYLERMVQTVGDGGRIPNRLEKVKEEVEPKRGNHHSNPSPDHEAEEEQAALDSVVEQAKAAAASQALEEAHVSATEKTLQKVVKDKQSTNSKPLPVAKPPKDPSRYKRLLPLNSPSRRYLYGANFIPSAADHEGVLVEDPEYSNKKVKVPSKKTLERLFRENKETYEKEEQGWREFEWKAPEVDMSLNDFIKKLTPEELSLRSWIRELHSLPTASGVGLGASSLSPFPPPSLSTSLSLLSPTPAFTRGNEAKYAELMVQAKEGFEGKCQGSNWLDSYKTMHSEMLEGKRDPKFISYHCEKGMNCGGLGDRLLGMTSAFFFGLITQRSFLGEWQSPIPLDVVFDSPSVNWSYSSFTSSRHPILGQQSLIDQSAELDIIHFDRLSVDSTFGSTSWNPKKGKKWTKGFEKRDIAYASNWIKFFTNRGMIYRSFAYKHLQKSVNRLGLAPSTTFACINQYLFRPKPPALNLISEYTSVLALPSVFSVGIHVRTGDRSMKDSEYDKINTVKRHSQFFRCARELGETYASPSQQIVYYLVTDSAHLKSDARSVLGSKLVTTDMIPQHVHQKSGHVDGVFSAVVEDWILAKTDMMVATQDSGFGKLASFMHAKENTTVTIFPRFNEDVNGLQSKKSHIKVDCTDPNVFTTFEELSSEWSLG